MAYQDGLHLIPPHMHDAVRLYVERGIAGGSFLTAVLSDSLTGAYRRADEANLAAMRQWVQFIYWHLPVGCWGSPGAVSGWVKRGGLAGREEAA